MGDKCVFLCVGFMRAFGEIERKMYCIKFLLKKKKQTNNF